MRDGEAAQVSSVTTPDGVGIAVHDLGGSGPIPVLFAHGIGLHGLVWAPLVEELGRKFRCYSFDARAHGNSGRPARGDLDWGGLGTDVLAVVAELGMSRPCAVGHSSGATALLLAEEMQPGTFEKIYCFEPVLVPADPPLGRDPDSWLAAEARGRREVFASRDEAYRHYTSRSSFAAVAPAALQAYVDYGTADVADGSVRLKCQRDDEALFYEMATAHDCFVRLHEVSCPVMLASGGRTGALTADLVASLAARLPSSRTEVLPGVGHLAPMEEPRSVAASITAFFRSDPRAHPAGPRHGPATSIPLKFL